jgi:hypothetical protein
LIDNNVVLFSHFVKIIVHNYVFLQDLVNEARCSSIIHRLQLNNDPSGFARIGNKKVPTSRQRFKFRSYDVNIEMVEF